jgi:hypothetical protein
MDGVVLVNQEAMFGKEVICMIDKEGISTPLES